MSREDQQYSSTGKLSVNHHNHHNTPVHLPIVTLHLASSLASLRLFAFAHLGLRTLTASFAKHSGCFGNHSATNKKPNSWIRPTLIILLISKQSTLFVDGKSAICSKRSPIELLSHLLTSLLERMAAIARMIPSRCQTRTSSTFTRHTSIAQQPQWTQLQILHRVPLICPNVSCLV